MNLENIYLSLRMENYHNINYRDPMPCPSSYKERLEYRINYVLRSISLASQEFKVPDLPEVQNRRGVSGAALKDIDEVQNFLYLRGDDIEILHRHLIAALPFVEQVRPMNMHFESEELGWKEDEGTYPCYDIISPIIQQAILLLREPDIMKSWMTWAIDRSYYISDILARSFIPDWPIAKKYRKLDRYDNIRMHHGLQTVLSAPDKAGKQAGIERYMAQWNGMMRPFGWKPKRNYDPRPGYGDDLFLKFAYEAALVVCGWDLDDSAFRDHPYYPRDLVDYYRAHVRHTRDAWRPEGVGAGIPVMPPPPPKKIDLHKSKAKGYKRWLELTCDGDKNACTDTLEALGTLRSLKNSWDEVFDQLSGNGHAVRADLKDPDTLQAQIDALATQRPLAEFTPPDDPPAGPARCEMLMQQAPAWAAAQGYTWQALNDGGDNWQAVLIRSEFHAEWLALSAALHLPPGLLG